jgi:hypothetical protein
MPAGDYTPLERSVEAVAANTARLSEKAAILVDVQRELVVEQRRIADALERAYPPARGPARMPENVPSPEWPRGA